MARQGDSSNLLVTFSPFAQKVYSGAIAEGFNFEQEGAEYALAPKYMASMKRKTGYDADAKSILQAAKQNPNNLHDISRLVPRISYGLQFSGSLNKRLFLKAKQEEAKKEFLAAMEEGSDMTPAHAALLYAKQYQASSPPGQQDSATQKVSPLTQIPFIQEVLGIPNEQYFINELFGKVALPQLHAEQPETDWIAAMLQLNPTQYVDLKEPDFISHFFEAKRNETPFILPREYRYRATIDPYSIYADAAARSLREAREALSLLALSDLTDLGTIPDPATNNSSGYPSAANNTKNYINGLIRDHWKTYRILIDSVVLGPETFGAYESNFYTNGYRPYRDLPEWGIVQLPGLKMPLRCAISPFMQEDRWYFFSSKYAFTGEGPQVTESWAKPEANSDAGAWRDYVDIVIFNAARAGFKVTTDGTTPDSEITTLKEARDLVKPGDGILNTET